ncbi:hypothetical protein EW026_g5869 [Hermanssonia centrifuga]|uniref:Chromosome segregation in meiosis protein n=1 Tax=Hermanssonia centrifuga TaxID=98765 RepID=A0A4S4KCT0_9APHY|nr:hypothetical protein EW026_g5869 [Hermanssonia centrifuga]
MSMSLDEIWDEPVSNSPRPASSARPSPSKRRRTTLFLSSDEDNDDAPATTHYRKRTPEKRPEIEALFDTLDDEDDVFGGLAPSLDLDTLRKQAESHAAKNPSLTPHAILPSSSPPRDIGDEKEDGDQNKSKGKGNKDGLHKRKPIPRLDEARLLGPDGFPALVKQAKYFKPRGKGHELSDLNRLTQIYQFWSHKMYPKGAFRDNVQRVEKLCHSKRMHNALSVWRDESKGLVNGMKPEEFADLDSSSSSDENENTADPMQQKDSTTTDGAEQLTSRSSSPPPRPPSSVGTSLGGDDDFDAMIREEEDLAAASGSTQLITASTSNTAINSRPAVDDDDAMWDELGEDFGVPVTSQPAQATAAITVSADDDEEMWDIVREMEEAQTASAGPGVEQPATIREPENQDPQKSATNDEGWDEMYL